MNNQHDIEDVLTSWGKNSRQEPVNNQILKSEILSKEFATAKKIAPTRAWPLWFSLSLTGVAVILFFVNLFPTVNFSSPKLWAPSESSPTAGVSAPQNSIIAPDYYPRDVTPVSDNREFLKKDYNATLSSRDVSELVDRIQITVRGFNGRVDGSSGSVKNGYVSFVIPASSLETFRAQIKTLVPGKFYAEQIYTQNLLPQKQSIEQSRTEAEKTLAQLQASRQQLITAHSSAVNSLQQRLNAVAKEQTALQSEVTFDPARQAQINARLDQLAKQKISLQSQLVSENNSYSQKLGSWDSQISYTQTNLENIQKQDQSLVDNVATVQGYIAINWISLWEAADLYMSGPLVAWLFLAAALAVYLWQRRTPEILLP
ncbi:MAG: hypothetical protein A3H14_01375 [Candidatus Doudnabacteria bacterium RIFCSPLOWO2_12_FULL_49_8]|nr:MAG: hypothetical protein A3H14_01375 [Candidatus Doudnabacteria bacterium RIFCSPLOWO2_12_FULL_49_8]